MEPNSWLKYSHICRDSTNKKNKDSGRETQTELKRHPYEERNIL